MEGKKLFYNILCGVGGGMMGFCSDRLGTSSGAVMFVLGAAVFVFSARSLRQ